MNKKTLFLIAISFVFPLMASAAASKLCSMVGKVENAIWMIGGSCVVIGWVIAGILYLTAGGGERLGVAKKALVAAIIGTVLVIISASAASIVQDTIGNGMIEECKSIE